MNSPIGLSLVQMHEGIVSIAVDQDNSLIPPNATHLKIYLSSAKSVLGNLYATIRTDSVGGLFFNAPKGWFGYATVRAFAFPADESTNIDGFPLQMFEMVLPGYNIIHFFHDKRTGFADTQFAIGYRQSDNAVFLFKSTNYFTTWRVVKYWASGVIDNGGWLSFYIDKFGIMYIGSRPSALMSKDNGNTWYQLPRQFQNPVYSVITPFWNVTEDETTNLILFSEYGTDFNNGHHRLIWSTDPMRINWFQTDLNWGFYRHIHGYHINPYKPNVHLLFLGDPLDLGSLGSSYDYPTNDKTPGLYVSTDSGVTWGPEILNQGGNTVNFGGDKKFRNAPCMVTWWKSGKAFIANDSGERSIAAWYGLGPTKWDYFGIKPNINMLGNVDRYSTWPATPWDAKAVENGYETYCVSNHLEPAIHGDTHYAPDPNVPGYKVAYTPPSVLWRFDPDPAPDSSDDGVFGKKHIIAKAYWPANSFLFISAGRNNTFPENADYVFCNGWGGIRIPRKVIKNKPIIGVINTDPNTSTDTG